MAEVLSAQLQLDISAFTSALQQAQQRMAAFAQHVNQQMAALTQSVSANTTATQQHAAATQQQTAATQQHATANNTLLIAMQNLQATARQHLSTLQGMATQLAQTTTATQQATTATHQMTQATQHAAQATSSWGSVWQIVAGLGIATTLTGIIHALKGIVVESVQLAVKMQALQAGFLAISGGALAATKDLAFVRSEATRMGIEFFATARGFRDFAAATKGTGLEGQKTKDIFQGLTESARVLGLSTAESHHMFLAFEQMLSKGKVSAEELRRQLSNVLPGAFEIAARSVGKTTAELDELLRSGKMISEVFVPKMVAQMQRELGGGLEEATRQAQANFQRLGNEIHLFGVEIGNSLLTILNPIAEFLTKNLQQVRQMREAIQEIRTQEITTTAQARGIDPKAITADQLRALQGLYGEHVRLQEGPGGLAGELQRTVPALAAAQKAGVAAAKEALDAMYEQIYAQQTLTKLKQAESDIDSKIALAEGDATAALKRMSEILGTINTRAALTGEQFSFISSKYDTLIRNAAASTGADAGLLSRLISQESGFNPIAESRKGALGLTQIMPGSNEAAGGWARKFGLSDTDLLDPAKSITAGAKILVELGEKYKEFDDATRLALAAFNAGEPKIDAAIRQVRQAGLTPSFQNIAGLLPKETQKYVPAVYGAGVPDAMMDALGKKDLQAEYTAQIKALKDIQDLLTATPGLAARLTPELRAQVEVLAQQTIETKKHLEAMQKEPGEAAHAAQTIEGMAKKLDQQRAASALLIEQFATSAETDQQRRTKIFQDEEKWMHQFAEDGAKQVEIHQATTNRLAALDEQLAAKRQAITDKIEQYASAPTVEARQRVKALQDEEKWLKEVGDDEEMRAQIHEATANRMAALDEKIAARRQVMLDKIDQYASGPTVFARQRTKALQEEEAWVKAFADDEEVITRIHEGTANRLEKIDTDWRTHQENELRKAQKPWQDLAQDIQRTLSSAFEQVLSGTFDLWDMIKKGFIKLLADMAAAAITQRIIIPLLIGAVGAGTAGMGYAGVSGAEGTYGAGGAGGNMLGTAMGFAQNGAGIYQGMTGNTLLGSTGILGGVMATSLGSIFGFGGSTTAGAFFGGGEAAAGVGAYGMGVDAGAVGVASPVAGSSSSMGTLAGTSVGTALGAIAVGVAAGQIFAKLNAMMGLHGTANTVLSGAGGGAIAGSMILPGIGTAVGAAVGAIGGLIAGILTKTHKPEPLFDPRSVEAGQVGYTEAGGLELTREFNISSVKIRDLQYATFHDWEKTFGEIEGGINDMAAQVVASFQGVSPKFQEALVEPLNQAFAEIAGKIAGLKIEGKDAADFGKNLQEMMSETIPGFFNDATKGIVAKLQAAVKKVEPVFEGFQQIIETLTQDIETLHAQQRDMHTVLQNGITQLQGATQDANAQLGLAGEAFVALNERFLKATEAEQITLGPIIAQAANELFAAVLTHIRAIQQQNLAAMEQLNQTYTTLGTALYTPAQQEAWQRQEYDLLRNRLLAASEAEQAGLAQQLAQMGQQVFSTAVSYVRSLQQANTAAMQTAKLAPQLEAGTSFASLNESYRTLQAELDTPARLYMRKREEYDTLKSQFASADAPTKMAMAPQLAQAGAELLRLAKSQEVLGQDIQLVKELQTSLMQDMTAAWTALGTAQQAWNAAIVAQNEAEQARVDAHNAALLAANAELEQTLVGLQAQLQQDMTTAHGLLATTNATLEQRLVGLQESLVANLAWVDTTIQADFDRLQGAVQVQIDIATHQQELLTASLSHLDSVDGVVQASLDVLHQMQDRIGGPNVGTDALVQAQVVLLGGLSTIGAEQLQVLKDMNTKLGGGVRGYAEGSTYIPQNMLAFLHRGERVIPAGGNGTNTINQTITIRAEGDSVANQAYSAQLRDAIIGDIERQARLGRTNIMVKR